MRDCYTRAYRLLRQTRKNLPWTPRHVSFWGRRVLSFQQASPLQRLAMQAAADSIGMIVTGSTIRYVPQTR